MDKFWLILDVLKDWATGLAFLAYAGNELIKYVKKKKEKKLQQVNYAQLSIDDSIVRQKIYKILWEELARYTPQGRIVILQYHNGGKFYTGRDIQRMTLTFEVKHPDLSSIKTEYQGIVIGEEFDNHQQMLIGEAYHGNLLDVKDEGIKAIMMHHNFTAFYAVMCKSQYGVPLASIVYGFNKYIDPLTEANRLAIKRKSNTIFNLLADIKDRRVAKLNQ